MKFRYTKYIGDPLGEIDLEDLVSKLSDLLLSSGFSNPWSDPSMGDDDRTMQALHDAILEALFNGGVLSDEALQQLLGDPADADQESARQQLEDLIQQVIERMMEQGFITTAPDLDQERERRGAGWRHRRGPRAGDLRGDGQGARLPRLPCPERSARLIRTQQRRPPRHQAPVDRRRDAVGSQALRVRRHAQHRSEQHDPERRAATSRRTRWHRAATEAASTSRWTIRI